MQMHQERLTDVTVHAYSAKKALEELETESTWSLNSPHGDAQVILLVSSSAEQAAKRVGNIT
jgi:hypothetical protein